jgi:hypothetical protein
MGTVKLSVVQTWLVRISNRRLYSIRPAKLGSSTAITIVYGILAFILVFCDLRDICLMQKMQIDTTNFGNLLTLELTRISLLE